MLDEHFVILFLYILVKIMASLVLYVFVTVINAIDVGNLVAFKYIFQLRSH